MVPRPVLRPFQRRRRLLLWVFQGLAEPFSAARVLPARHLSTSDREKEIAMLHWTVVFFVIAIVAGLFGFTGIASASVGIAQILFLIFAVLFIASLAMQLIGRRG